jgi:hypothetical protein
VTPQDKWGLALIPLALIGCFVLALIYIGKGH